MGTPLSTPPQQLGAPGVTPGTWLRAFAPGTSIAMLNTRSLTIMFTDIVGYTAQTAQLSRQSLRRETPAPRQ